MDIRKLSTGYIRVRFKLSSKAHKTVSSAMQATQRNFPNSAIELIALNSISGVPAGLCSDEKGKNRLLIKLHPEQYENLKCAMDSALYDYSSPEDALTAMSSHFLYLKKNKGLN